MKIDFFDVEAWMTEHEKDYCYNLAETCVDSMNINDIESIIFEVDDIYCQKYSFG